MTPTPIPREREKKNLQFMTLLTKLIPYARLFFSLFSQTRVENVTQFIIAAGILVRYLARENNADPWECINFIFSMKSEDINIYYST